MSNLNLQENVISVLKCNFHIDALKKKKFKKCYCCVPMENTKELILAERGWFAISQCPFSGTKIGNQLQSKRLSGCMFLWNRDITFAKIDWGLISILTWYCHTAVLIKTCLSPFSLTNSPALFSPFIIVRVVMRIRITRICTILSFYCQCN